MKIVQIVPRYHPEIGGVEYVVRSVAEGLHMLGNESYVLTGDSRIDSPQHEEIAGVDVTRWPTWSPGQAYHFPRKRSRLEDMLENLAKDADVVHFHNIHSVFTMSCLNSLRKFSVRKVLTPYYHGSGHTQLRRLLWIVWRRLTEEAIQRTDDLIVHTVSSYEASIFEEDYGLHAIPIENGVDEWITNMTWSPGDYIMYSGRIEKYKNIDRLAKIVGILDAKFNMKVRLMVIGEGPFKATLRESLRHQGIDGEFLPHQPFGRYIQYLSNARLFALISEKESYPQSVNEANAIGTPVVVSKPWGENFADRSRTLILDLSLTDDRVAGAISNFMKASEQEGKSHVPTWSDVVRAYINGLYLPVA